MDISTKLIYLFFFCSAVGNIILVFTVLGKQKLIGVFRKRCDSLSNSVDVYMATTDYFEERYDRVLNKYRLLKNSHSKLIVEMNHSKRDQIKECLKCGGREGLNEY